MPCFQCGKQFTVLSREHSCDECKRLFCSRCLRYKHKVSTPTVHTMKLCYACYERINNPNQQHHTRDLDPPKILLDRMMRLEINRTPPHVKPINTANGVTSNSNTSQDDLESRTKKLLYDVPTGSIPSFEELESRLHKLMDVKASEVGPSKVFPELSDEEKVSRIISQLTEEAQIDAACGYVDPEPKEKSHEPSEDDDELPWCSICNEDATIRCVQCEDLFCDRCSKKGHSNRQFKNHTLVRYAPKKRAKT